jgi:hypothetical protein
MKSSQKEQEVAATDQPAGKLFTFTIDATTGQVVKFEALDASGAHRELSDEERASLVHDGSERLEDALEQAFEAGIDCVLGSEGEQDDSEESAQDSELRHLLLAPLIEHSAAKRLLQREALNRAILGTLIQRSVKPTPAPTAGPEANRGAAGRTN